LKNRRRRSAEFATYRISTGTVMLRFRALFARSWTAGLTVFLVTLGFFVTLRVAASAEPVAPPSEGPSKRQIAAWVEQLGDVGFQRREAAMELLTSAGVAAIDELAAAAIDDSPEVAWRAGEVLERIAVSGNEEAVEGVCLAMDRLAKTHRQFEGRSADLKSRWRELRHARAAARLTELGARLHENTFDDWRFLSPVASPLFLTPDSSVEVIDAADLMYEVEDLILEEIAEDAAELETEARKRRDLSAITTTKIEPLLERALREEEPEVVRTEKVVVEEPASPDTTPAEYADPTILKPVAEDVPGTESFAGDPAELLEDAAGEVEVDGITMSIDISDIEVYDSSYALTDIRRISGLSEGRSLEIGADWKGTDDDLRLLRELSGVRRLTVTGQTLSEAAFQHISEVKQLAQLTLQNDRYEVKDVVAYKRLRPEVAVQAVGPAMLGIGGEPVAGGLQITYVVDGAEAARAGIRPGDVLTRIDGRPVADFEVLSWIVAARRVGEVLKVEVRRGEKTLTLAVKLGAR
jgi:hypothetical protein